MGPVATFLRSCTQLALRGRITGLSAEVAFWGVLSFVPLALVLASLLSALRPVLGTDGVSRAQRQAVDAVERVFPGSGEAVGNTVNDLFQQPRTGLLSAAIVLTIWSSGRVFAAVANAFGSLIGGRDRRPWIVRRLLGVGLGFGSILVVTGLLAAAVLDPFDLGTVGTVVLSGAVILMWLTTIYRLAAGRRELGHQLSWRQNVPGVVVAAVAWGLTTLGFRIYLEVQAGNPVVVGLGGILVAMLWMYLLAVGLLAGQVVNVVAYHWPHDIPQHNPNDNHS